MNSLLKKTGVCLVDLLKLDQPGKGKQKLQQELLSLSMEGKSAVRDYYVRKVSAVLAILAAGALLSALCLALYLGRGQETETQLLARPGYGEGDRKEELTVEIEGQDEPQRLEVTVQERKYTEKEKQELLDRAMEELDRSLPGENKSLDEVRTDLNFPESLEDGAVMVSWSTIPYGVIGEDGTLRGSSDENGTLVEIQGSLTCGGREAFYSAYAKVFPPELPEEERVRESVRREVERADASESHEESLRLPETAEGRTLIWRRPSENPAPAVLALTLILAAAVYLEMDSRVHQRAEERKSQLMLDYPDLMWKMTMLLGAGLSMKGTFSRISEEYLREREGKRAGFAGFRGRGQTGENSRNRRVRYVYEEITCTCYEMQSGIPEAQAYERFGRRCQLPEYIRLGSVLSQNLKKGAKGLTALLEKEAEASLNERKNHARKIGERSGTRLLLPMTLMLGIVLVILMVPAFLSF